jgi:hypothetical protein
MLLLNNNRLRGIYHSEFNNKNAKPPPRCVQAGESAVDKEVEN